VKDLAEVLVLVVMPELVITVDTVRIVVALVEALRDLLTLIALANSEVRAGGAADCRRRLLEKVRRCHRQRYRYIADCVPHLQS